jgi:hypothetical protein
MKIKGFVMTGVLPSYSKTENRNPVSRSCKVRFLAKVDYVFLRSVVTAVLVITPYNKYSCRHLCKGVG